MALEAAESRSNGLSCPTCSQCPMFEEPTLWCLLSGGHVMGEQRACDEFCHWWPVINEMRGFANMSEREYILQRLTNLESYLATPAFPNIKRVLDYRAFHAFLTTLREKLKEIYGSETKREVLVEERAGGNGVPWA